MANPTKYYYNTTRFPITLVGDDDGQYFCPPRSYTYLICGLKSGYTVPTGMITHNLPAWWKMSYWPKANPWDNEYDPYANVRP
jgi:hypothetical protein